VKANHSKIFGEIIMVESLLSGIVLGLVPVTIAGLLVTAYLQYRRGDSLNF
jgi:cytochrome b6-f complex subunit 5